ncbi:MAG: hypothetical protein WCF57_09420 [Pyrinomonadaceae bacterium]
MTPANPHVIVKMDGDHYDSWRHQSFFQSIRVDLRTKEASQAEISVVDLDYKFLNKYTRADGVPLAIVRVWLGFGVDLGEPVFKGMLSEISRPYGITTITFDDMSFKMRIDQRAEYHKSMTDIQIIQKVVERNDLMFDGPGGDFKPLMLKSERQEAETDWDLISRLAEDAGLVLYVRGDTVFARLPAKTGEPVLTLDSKEVRLLRGEELRYTVPEGREGRPRRVESRGHDDSDHRLTGVSDLNQRGTVLLEIKRSIKSSTKAEADRRARAKKELQREKAFSGRVGIIPAIRKRVDVRDTIRLVNRGELFPGKYLVDAVTYDYSSAGLKTEFDLVRDVREF